MSIRKILIVDDSRTELYFLSDLLNKNGYVVRTAENGEQALAAIEQERPDLVLMDIVMPGLNGFQLTRQITRNPAYRELPIIVCTSKSQETDKLWAMRQGARDYVTKPVDPHDLLSKIMALN
jgi:twitching motility two-component system response regulator PilH